MPRRSSARFHASTPMCRPIRLLGLPSRRVQKGAMPRNEIVAHLIIGRRREPYLPAVLESIADACAVAVINDNGGSIPGPNDDFIDDGHRARIGDRLEHGRS